MVSNQTTTPAFKKRKPNAMSAPRQKASAATGGDMPRKNYTSKPNARPRFRPSVKKLNAAIASLHMVLVEMERQDLKPKQHDALTGPVLRSIHDLQSLLP